MSLALIDFSSLFHRLWNVNRVEVEHKCLSFVNRLNEDEVIICVDSPPYQRKKEVPSYKANRDVPDPELVGLLRSTIEKLAEDGYKIASCEGWEADDVIATLVTQNTEDSVTVYGTDKDLLQVCDLTVPFTDEVKTPENTLGVPRNLVVDYLSLVGDSSDNVKGVSGIGPKTAVKMLQKFGTLNGIRDAVKSHPESFTEKTSVAIYEAEEWLDQTVRLITLRTDLEVSFEKRERKEAEYVECETIEQSQIQKTSQKDDEPRYIVKHEEIDYRHSLEPVGIDQAWKAAMFLHRSGLYQSLKGPEQVMAIIMRGRALGIDATTALDQMNIIQGRPTLSAQAVIAIIKSSPKCKYFHLEESTPETCTWETFRVGDPKPTRKTMTREEADSAGFTLQPEYVWEGNKKRRTGKIVTKDQWEKQPATMLMWRTGVALGRPVYPDLLNGIYSTEEFE